MLDSNPPKCARCGWFGRTWGSRQCAVCNGEVHDPGLRRKAEDEYRKNFRDNFMQSTPKKSEG